MNVHSLIVHIRSLQRQSLIIAVYHMLSTIFFFVTVSAGEWPRSNNSSIPRSMTRIAAGSSHSLMVTKDGTVLSFGDFEAYTGNLGRGSSTEKAFHYTPGYVLKEDQTQLKDIVAVAAGYSFSLALDVRGTVWSWGTNESGQLGRSTGSSGRERDTYANQVPDAVFNSRLGSRPIAIAAGASHALALLADGTVAAWGLNSEGQLGTGLYRCGMGSAPIDAVAPTRVLRAAGTIACDTTPDDGVDNKVPIDMTEELPNVIAIAAGPNHSLALCADGTVWAWGGNDFGQLGDPDRTELRYLLATKVKIMNENNQFVDLIDIIGIECGHKHSVAVRSDGASFAWGRNADGALGVASDVALFRSATRQKIFIPGQTSIPTLATGVIAVVAGGNNSMILCGNGKIYASGLNSSGERGDVTDAASKTELRPVADQDVLFPFGVAEISMGHHHSMVMATNRNYYSWGSNGNGQLGVGPDPVAHARPVPLSGIPPGSPGVGVVAVDGSINHTMVLKGDGRVIAWGSNAYKQLGRPDRSGTCEYSSLASTMCTLNQANTSVLEKPGQTTTPLQGIIAVACGHNHSHALQANGKVYSWGEGSMGTLGAGKPISKYKAECTIEPYATVAGNEYRAVAIESSHRFESQFTKTASFVLAVTDEGKVLSWGKNMAMECARGVNSDVDGFSSPGFVVDSTTATLKNVVSVAGCGYWAVALDSKGRLWRWGGYPTDYRDYPDVSERSFVKTGFKGNGGVSCARLVPGTENRSFKAISGASGHVLALKADGSVWRLDKVLTMVPKEKLNGIRSISCGGQHNLALLANGTLKTWGWNGGIMAGDPAQYQLARQTGGIQDLDPADAGMIDNSSKRLMEGVRTIGAGMLYSMALRGDGTMWTTGQNTDGANGDVNIGGRYERFTKLSTLILYQKTDESSNEDQAQLTHVADTEPMKTGLYSEGYVRSRVATGYWQGNEIEWVSMFDVRGALLASCSAEQFMARAELGCSGMYFVRLACRNGGEVFLYVLKD